MNYYIEKHDMQIIVSALCALREDMMCAESNSPTGITRYHKCGYAADDIDVLLNSLYESEEEAWDLK